MTPEPTVDHTLAERVARAVHKTSHPAMASLEFGEAPNGYRTELLRKAEHHLRAMEAAGLAVVELPEVNVHAFRTNRIPALKIDVPTSDGSGWQVTGMYVPGHECEDRVTLGGQGFPSISEARRDTLRVLAACAAVERLRAQWLGGDPR